MLEGSGNLNLAVNTGGATVEAMKRSLGGNASVALKDGALKGINLGEKLREARNMFKANTGTQNQASDKTQKTDFTEMSVSFQLQNGVARSNDLSLKSPLLRVGGVVPSTLVAACWTTRCVRRWSVPAAGRVGASWPT